MGVFDLFRMDGRVDIITGGSRGLGKAMAEALAEAGAIVIVTSRAAKDVEAVAAELEATYGQAARGYACDVTNPDQVEALVEAGSLNHGQGTALIVKLEAAIRDLEKGKPGTALNVLNAFSNQVTDFGAGGVLTPEEGQSLLDAVHAIMHQIRIRYGVE